jgi:hypothetical protein
MKSGTTFRASCPFDGLTPQMIALAFSLAGWRDVLFEQLDQLLKLSQSLEALQSFGLNDIGEKLRRDADATLTVYDQKDES